MAKNKIKRTTPLTDKPLMNKSELKWCDEAKKRSDRSLLTTLYKMHEEPDKVREYHWIAYNEMCFRGIEDDPMPTKQAVATGANVKAERLPAVQKDFGPGWKEGAIVCLTRSYAGSFPEGIITCHWTEDFGFDFEVRIKAEEPGKPMHGKIFINRDELELRKCQDAKKNPVKFYVSPKPVIKSDIDIELEALAQMNRKPIRKRKSK